MSRDDAVRLGVLGCGWIAGNRLAQIARSGLADVVVVADPDPQAVQLARRLAPGARTADELMESDLRDVDGVMISTPSALHAPQALMLLEAGIPVFVQKPLALSAAEVDRLLRLAAAADIPLGTDLCYRHLQCAGALRQALQRPGADAPFLIEGRFHNAYRPNAGWSRDAQLAGGGALMDLGIHLMDLVMWLTDAPLTLERSYLLCEGRPAQPGDIEDFASIDLSLPDGAQVRIDTSWDASTGYDAEIRLRIHYRDGALELANHRGSFFHFDAWRFRGTDVERLGADRDDGWQAGPLRDWLRRVQEGWGYEPPKWAQQAVDLVDRAYTRQRRAASPGGGAAGAYPCSREGVLP